MAFIILVTEDAALLVSQIATAVAMAVLPPLEVKIAAIDSELKAFIKTQQIRAVTFNQHAPTRDVKQLVPRQS
jgi:hypothetical protein